MNKPDFHKYTSDEDICEVLKYVYGKMSGAVAADVPKNTYFLSETEKAAVKSMLCDAGIPFALYGGYRDTNSPCEREAVFYIPSYFDESYIEDEGAFAYIRLTPSKEALKYSRKDKLTHRDYLGSLLSLGIDRSKIGDISVYDEGADIIVCAEICEFILSEYKSTGNISTECALIERKDFKIPERKFEKITDTVASLRLDALVAVSANLSRSDAEKAVVSGTVMVNHIVNTDTDTKLKAGDVLSIKGYGRYIFKSEGGQSKKGRTFITVLKYV